MKTNVEYCKPEFKPVKFNIVLESEDDVKALYILFNSSMVSIRQTVDDTRGVAQITAGYVDTVSNGLYKRISEVAIKLGLKK